MKVQPGFNFHFVGILSEKGQHHQQVPPPSHAGGTMAFNDAENGTEAQLCYPRTLQDDLKLHTIFAQLLKI